MSSLWLGSWLRIACCWSNVAKIKLEWIQVGTGGRKGQMTLVGHFDIKRRRYNGWWMEEEMVISFWESVFIINLFLVDNF